MSRLDIALLGAPRVELDGAAIEVDTRKAIALVAYLAVTQQSHSRDTLATLFWPEYDQAHARAALRRTLSTLNAALNDMGLEVERETIGLKTGAIISVDVIHFRNWLAQCATHGHTAGDVCAACVTPLNEAVKLYRDDFLAGFTLRDSPNFDEWQFFQAETLRQELAGALERLTRQHSAQGEWETAIVHARRWLALDPLHEPAHRQLMQLYAWSGQRAAALRQYRECLRILHQELSVAPLAETTQLHEAIQANRQIPNPNLEPPTSNLQPSNPPTGYPLVGRASEWATLLGAFESIRRDGHWVVIEGEAGIGKTRLAEELLRHAQAQGVLCIVARCYNGESQLAYAPFIEGVRALVTRGSRKHWADVPASIWAELTRLVPELATWRESLPSVLPLDSAGAQSRFFDGMNQFLLAACRGLSPCRTVEGREAVGVLFLDDMQWADAASFDLLMYLVRRLRGQAWLILTTWRAEEVPSGHRLRVMLGEAQRAGVATALALPRLTRAAVEELARVLAPTKTLDERLYAETEGVPFFVVEYLTALGEAGASERTWPAGVRNLLQARLQAVSQAAAQMLNTAAVIGRSFDFDSVRVASGRGEEETVTALEELIARGLIAEIRTATSGESPIYDFSHEKLRALVYEETSQARRRLIHRRVADALAAPSRRRAVADRASLIAQHYQLAGADVQAAEYFKLAGEHTRQLYANAEALNHFGHALALGHPDTSALHEAIGDMQTLIGDYGAALTSYQMAVRTAPRVLGSVEHKIGNVYSRRGDWDNAESHFLAALNTLGIDAERARLYADWSLVAQQRGDRERASQLAQQALALAQAGGEQRALAEAHNILGILARKRGDLASAREHLQQSLRLAEMLNDANARMTALNNLALVYGDSGDNVQAIRLTETSLQYCVQLGDRHREAALHNNLADWLHASGQHEAGMTHLKQAVAIFAEIGGGGQPMQPEIWKLTEW